VYGSGLEVELSLEDRRAVDGIGGGSGGCQGGLNTRSASSSLVRRTQVVVNVVHLGSGKVLNGMGGS